MVIGLLAQKRAGKDTVADHLVEKYGFVRYGFADPVKEGARHMFDLSQEQLYGDLKEVVDERWGVTPRQILEALGTELSQYDLPRHLPAMAEKIGFGGRTIWVHRFKLWHEKNPHVKNIIFSDCRFIHECAAIMKLTNAEVWKIVRPGWENNSEHASEKESLSAPFNRFLLNNKTIGDLHLKVDGLMNGTFEGDSVE